MIGVNVSLIIYAFLAFAVVAFMVVGTYVLGQRHNERATSQPFESGILSTGSAKIRFPVHFYMVAMLFVVFDLESVFLYAWAVSVRELGVTGFIQVLVFISILLAALIYVVRLGILRFGPNLRKGEP